MLVLAFLMGLAGGFFINMNQGLVQANTPQALMGRVMGLYTLVTVGLMPFGALAARHPRLVDRHGQRDQLCRSRRLRRSS